MNLLKLKNNNLFYLLIVFIILFTVLPVYSDLTDEVEFLRDRISSLEENSPKIDLLCWFDLEFTKQFNPGTPSSFDQSHLYFIFNSEVRSDMKAYAELEFEHGLQLDENTTRGKILVEQAWFIYRKLNYEWKFGKFLVPYGIWVRNHWAPLTPTVTSPLVYQNQVYPEKATGIELSSSTLRKNGQWNYKAFISNGRGTREFYQDGNENKGLGFDLSWTEFNGIHGGVSWYFNREQTRNNKESIYSFYLKKKIQKHLLTMEFVKDSAVFEKQAVYLQDVWHFNTREQFTLRIEGYSPDSTTAGNDENRFICAYRRSLSENLIFKLEFEKHRFDNTTVKTINAIHSSMAVLF